MRRNKYWTWKKKYESNCKICNRKFKHSQITALFCSEHCKYKNYYKKTKKQTTISKCKQCNNEFNHIKRNAQFCSNKCYAKFNYNKENKKLMQKKENWKYKAFNYDDKQFNDINHMLIELEEELSMKQKYIVFNLVKNLYNERVKNEKGNNSISGI